MKDLVQTDQKINMYPILCLRYINNESKSPVSKYLKLVLPTLLLSSCLCRTGSELGRLPAVAVLRVGGVQQAAHADRGGVHDGAAGALLARRRGYDAAPSRNVRCAFILKHVKCAFSAVKKSIRDLSFSLLVWEDRGLPCQYSTLM